MVARRAAGNSGLAVAVVPCMAERRVLEPTAEHPITITPTGRRVTVRVNGAVVADTEDALTLQESTYLSLIHI